MKRVAIALMVLAVTASVAPVTAGLASNSTAQQASGEAYAGTHVSFDAEERAVTDYAVRNETMLDSVRVESASSVEDGGLVDLGGSLSAVTRIKGSVLGLEAESETEARVEADGGATLTAHDNERGILVVASGNESDYVVANVSEGANASAEGDSRVSVTTENGTPATFLVVGDGEVAVNDDGDVTARLGEDGRLVFRSYPDGRDDGDAEQERLIAEGDARAETYVMADGNETVVDTVSYDDNTTLSAEPTAEGAVEIAINRTTHEGTVLVASVSEAALNATEDLDVAVDGEAAIEAATYTQLESAVGSDRSRYMVEIGSNAEAGADVLVAVDHFSERTVTIRSADSSDSGNEEAEETTGAETTDDGTTASDETESGDEATDDGETTEADGTTEDAEATTDEESGAPADDGGSADGDVPGFTPVTAAVALVAAALLARLR